MDRLKSFGDDLVYGVILIVALPLGVGALGLSAWLCALVIRGLKLLPW